VNLYLNFFTFGTSDKTARISSAGMLLSESSVIYCRLALETAQPLEQTWYSNEPCDFEPDIRYCGHMGMSALCSISSNDRT